MIFRRQMANKSYRKKQRQKAAKRNILTKALPLFLMFVIIIASLSVSRTEASYTTSTQVPAVYASYISELKKIFPNATFTFDYIDEDFYTVLANQSKQKKVRQSTGDSLKAMYSSNYNWDTGEFIYSEGDWTYASYETIAYYLDPRNFLNEKYIFTFLEQSSDGTETLEGVQAILSGTFMYDYAEYVLTAAEESGVNAYVLASIMRNEQGTKVTSLSSGTYEGYEGYYNFFNVKATGTTTKDVIVNGLTYAKEQGWDSVEKSIIGGAKFYGSNYVNKGQDTYYYMHYNVTNGSSNYWHQYATAVWAATSSGSTLGTRSMEYLKNLKITFTIPVYNNMPSTACAKPAENSNLNNYYFTSLSTSAGSLSPAFDKYTNSYSLSVSGDTTLYYSLPSGASYAGSAAYGLSAGTNTVTLTVRSQTGYTRNYTITVTASKACKLTVAVGTSSGGSSSPSTATPATTKATTAATTITKATTPATTTTKATTTAPTTKATTTTAPTTTKAAETATILRGDANGDGKVSSADYVVVKKHILKTATITNSHLLSQADANQDGKISTADYVWIKNKILGK